MGNLRSALNRLVKKGGFTYILDKVCFTTGKDDVELIIQYAKKVYEQTSTAFGIGVMVEPSQATKGWNNTVNALQVIAKHLGDEYLYRFKLSPGQLLIIIPTSQGEEGIKSVPTTTENVIERVKSSTKEELIESGWIQRERNNPILLASTARPNDKNLQRIFAGNYNLIKLTEYCIQKHRPEIFEEYQMEINKRNEILQKLNFKNHG